MVKNLPECTRPGMILGSGRSPGGGNGNTLQYSCLGNPIDRGSISGLASSPGGGNGKPLQYPCLRNPMNRGAWQSTVHGVTKS